jgi:hypothetical protein
MAGADGPFPEPTEYLTVHEIATRLRISESTLFGLIHDGQLTASTGPSHGHEWAQRSR